MIYQKRNEVVLYPLVKGVLQILIFFVILVSCYYSLDETKKFSFTFRQHIGHPDCHGNDSKRRRHQGTKCLDIGLLGPNDMIGKNRNVKRFKGKPGRFVGTREFKE